MGANFAPSYANLAMGYWEKNFITHNNPYCANIVFFGRYIDDIIIIWDGPIDLVPRFVEHCNSNPYSLSFTHVYDHINLTFLDLDLGRPGNRQDNIQDICWTDYYSLHPVAPAYFPPLDLISPARTAATCSSTAQPTDLNATSSALISHLTFWRPWIHNSSNKTLPYVSGLCENPQSGQKATEYNHPVRLFWPKSKPLDNVYLEAADLLRRFPVQATLSFYNDSESDTDNEENNNEEEHDSGFESE
ncbi:uncharacterized protein [Aquarana catesbeiana]|uniref:uncharacterized protein n=1 Tax=Aquarana catesbeiana TaxID=8400 RepID=UPI003CC99C78